jgi:hypothetical protein
VAERAHQFTPHKQCICSVIRELTWARNVALVVRGGMSEGGAARVTRRDHPDLPDFGTILPVTASRFGMNQVTHWPSRVEMVAVR